MAGNSDPSGTKRRRGPGRPLPPGVSGNPYGRPRAALDVQALARVYTVQAINALVKALDDGRLCVSAAAILLDRAWGRPAPPLDLDDADRVTSLVLNIVHQPAAATPVRTITITPDDGK